MGKRLFIVDDDEDILFSLQLWFERKGYLVNTFSHSAFLNEALDITPPDIMLLDVNLRNEDGRAICKVLKEKHLVHCPIVLFSANPENLKRFEEWLADGIIEKPFDLNNLTRVIGSYLMPGDTLKQGNS